MRLSHTCHKLEDPRNNEIYCSYGEQSTRGMSTIASREFDRKPILGSENAFGC